MTIDDALLVTAAALVVLAIVVLYRAVRGPTMQDRVVAVNVLGTNTVVILALLSAALDVPSFLDIALVYALLKDRKSTRLNSSHSGETRMPSSA